VTKKKILAGAREHRRRWSMAKRWRPPSAGFGPASRRRQFCGFDPVFNIVALADGREGMGNWDWLDRTSVR